MTKPSTDTELEQIRQIVDEVGSAGNEFWHKGSLDFWMGEVEPLIATLTTEAYERGREDTSKVTRFEVIDHREASPTPGRIVVAWGTVKLSFQDADRTLKVFLTDALTKTAGEGKHE